MAKVACNPRTIGQALSLKPYFSHNYSILSSFSTIQLEPIMIEINTIQYSQSLECNPKLLKQLLDMMTRAMYAINFPSLYILSILIPQFF